jgi:hypothetical protein
MCHIIFQLGRKNKDLLELCLNVCVEKNDLISMGYDIKWGRLKELKGFHYESVAL